MPYCILIADDDPAFCDILQRALSSEPWTVKIARDGREALDLLCTSHFDLAVLDFAMPHLTGLEVLEAVKQKGIQTDIIILTGYGTIPLTVQAMKAGAREFIEKPIKPIELVATIRRLLESRHFPPHVRAARLDTFLKDHGSDPSLKLSDLCRHFRISPAYVARLFQKYIGASFRRRLSYHRVQKAKHLLESTGAPLYLIAGECGFKNYRRLIEAFGRLEGIPPGKYRKICRDRRTK